MSLTLAAKEKPSTVMGKMCSLLPLNHRVHKDNFFLFKGFFLDYLPPNVRTHLIREDISVTHKLAAKAYKSGSHPPPDVCMLCLPLLCLFLIKMNSSLPSANVLSLALLHVLLLSLLHVLSVLLHNPPPQPLTSAGIIANTETKLCTAVLLVPGFRETSWLARSSCSSFQRFNLVFLQDSLSEVSGQY